MLWDSAIIWLLFSYVVEAHSAHHTHHVEQKPISQERLDELERKWGIDVDIEASLCRWFPG